MNKSNKDIGSIEREIRKDPQDLSLKDRLKSMGSRIGVKETWPIICNASGDTIHILVEEDGISKHKTACGIRVKGSPVLYGFPSKVNCSRCLKSLIGIFLKGEEGIPYRQKNRIPDSFYSRYGINTVVSVSSKTKSSSKVILRDVDIEDDFEVTDDEAEDSGLCEYKLFS